MNPSSLQMDTGRHREMGISGSPEVTVGLDDIKGLLQPKWSYETSRKQPPYISTFLVPETREGRKGKD